MWSDLFLPPVRNQYPGLSQSGEDLPVEQFVPQFPVKRLYIAILPGAARSINSVFTPSLLNHKRTVLAVNSGPNSVAQE